MIPLFSGHLQEKRHQQECVDIEAEDSDKEQINDQSGKDGDDAPSFLPVIPEGRHLLLRIGEDEGDDGKGGKCQPEKKGDETGPRFADVIELEPHRFDHDQA